MIDIKEISIDEIDKFWEKHIKYLIEDKIITDEEDVEYFSGREYRDILESHMVREKDKHHIAYFMEDGLEIGAVQFTTYHSEDGKCFILDYWIYPDFRNKAKGTKCFKKFEEYTKSDGAKYYVLNSMKENSIKFWERLGFVEDGIDEYEMKLFRLY